MPQLEFATFASQIFWLAVTFGLLYIIMAKSALPVIREVLQNRQTRIAEDLKKAEKLKIEAEEAEADFTSVISSARSKASVLLATARKSAAVEADKRNTKLDETFVRQTKESEHRIEIIKKEVTEKMAPVIIDISQEMLKKLVGVSVGAKDVEKAVHKLENKVVKLGN
jgi:F-type H+-transporting ATPase subunit b